MKPSNDREAITLIIDGLIEVGVKPTEAIDGEQEVEAFTTTKAAVDHITSCDDGSLNVILPDGNETWLYFVLGNDPEEVLCDYGVSLSPYIDPIVNPWWE